MKKTVCMIALAAICFGTAAPTFAAVKDTKMADDSVKTKIKKKGDKMKMKKKMVDTTKKM